MCRAARLALPATGAPCREERLGLRIASAAGLHGLPQLYCSPGSWLVEALSNICAAGLLDLRCLQLARNAVRSRLELRTLAALLQLQDLTLAGNPVVAGMPERQRRILLWHMLPGQCPAALQCWAGCRHLCS